MEKITKVTFGQFYDVVNIETVENTFNDEDDVLFVVNYKDKELLITKSAVDDTIKACKEARKELYDWENYMGYLSTVHPLMDIDFDGFFGDADNELIGFINDVKNIIDGKIDEVEDPNDVLEKLFTYLIDSIEPINDGGRLYIE